MKKIIFAVFSLAMVFMLSVSIFAGVNVYVTVSDGSGDVDLAAKAVEVKDIDGDGSLTLDDAIYCAHEQYYEGGAEAGYKSYLGQYGLALEKLWGVNNGGSYGYYLNNASAMSLGDPVKDGDYISAFAYSDLTAWSDSYSWFDAHHTEVKAGEKLTLKLSSAGYDEAFNPIVLPVSGAVITVDGGKTEYVTDENGSVTIELSAGDHLISAVSDTVTLVPPVCIVNTADAPVVEAPQTADASLSVIVAFAFAAISLCVTAVRGKSVYEK